MGFGKTELFLALLFWSLASAAGQNSGYLLNPEVKILFGIKASLNDPRGVLFNWNPDDVDPCSWIRITCSPGQLVSGIAISDSGLSGTLSPSIGNLTDLDTLFLQKNNISGPIPQEIGMLSRLGILDLSYNFFSGEISTSFGHLKSLEYLRLNNNSLSGPFPLSLANITPLHFLDLSYNNFSGPIPRLPSKIYTFVGNPLICATGSEQNCYGTVPSLDITNSQSTPTSVGPKNHKVALAIGSTIICISISLLAGPFLWWRRKHNPQRVLALNG